jgi:ABC-type multidrug transport system permease subunit
MLRYYSILLFSAGSLALLITSNISKLVSTSRKLLSYISAFSGIVLVLFSFGLLFISYKPGLEWWKYLPVVSLGTSSITMTLSTLISAEQKRLRSTLNFISYILMFAGCVLIGLETINVDTIAANVASL